MLGAFTGVVLLGLVNDVLPLRNTSTFWIDAVNGAIILIALVVSSSDGGHGGGNIGQGSFRRLRSRAP